MKNLGPLIGLAAVYLLFCLWAGEPFYSSFNRVTVLTQSVMVTAGALGMTLIIVSGGIDLSAGSVIALSTVVIAKLLDAGWSPFTAAFAGVAVGGVCGAANGLLITRLKLVPSRRRNPLGERGLRPPALSLVRTDGPHRHRSSFRAGHP